MRCKTSVSGESGTFSARAGLNSDARYGKMAPRLKSERTGGTVRCGLSDVWGHVISLGIGFNDTREVSELSSVNLRVAYAGALTRCPVPTFPPIA